MALDSWPRRRAAATLGALAVLLGAAFLVWRWYVPRPECIAPGRFPEELVYVRSRDDVVNAGVLFSSSRDVTRRSVVIWVHGWGVNFYAPTYVAIGRALAELGHPCISANTRMHDLGTVEAWHWGKRIRGGGYWGVASDQVLDLAAWIDFAGKAGFEKVILVGHSAGWAAVRRYQAEEQDERVAGVVVASGAVGADTSLPDPGLLAEARRLTEEGRGDDLLRIPGRSYPSFVSPATFLDIANTPPEFKDFFGVQTPHPAVTRIRCPLLAFFGTRNDVGGEADLDRMKASIRRQASGPPRVDTVMIEGADHMYHGKERQVAETVARWIDSAVRGR